MGDQQWRLTSMIDATLNNNLVRCVEAKYKTVVNRNWLL